MELFLMSTYGGDSMDVMEFTNVQGAAMSLSKIEANDIAVEVNGKVLDHPLKARYMVAVQTQAR